MIIMSTLGVYTDDLFAEGCGSSSCLGGERRGYEQCNGGCILSNNTFITESVNGCIDITLRVKP